jgi:uncharacterized alpha-E superfamily protein
MISRVADHCFWFGRYLERAESTARVLHVTGNLALDTELDAEQCWMPVVIVAGAQQHFAERHGTNDGADDKLMQRYMTWEEDNLASIIRSVSAARDNARSIREVVSIEAWEAVNELYLWVHGAVAREEYARHRYGFYRHIRRQVQLVLGLLRSTMLHDTPLDFIWLGVMLERVGQTARVLDVHHHVLTGAPTRRHVLVDTAIWLLLLRACSGFEPFMKRQQGRVTASGVAAFLLLEPLFPRSIVYCVHSAYDRLCHIRPPEAASLPGGESLARLGRLDAWIREQTPDALGASVHEILTHVVDETAAVCNDVSRELFGIGAPAMTQSQAQA